MDKASNTNPLPLVCIKALSDKQHDKRKIAAVEIEKTVKDYLNRKELELIRKIILVLGQDFILSPNSHSRKGGLLGLASSAVALGKDSALFIKELIEPVITCFSDPDHNVRFFACQSLYNIAKVARSAVLPHFTEIFNGVSRLAADPEQNVKNGAELLDRVLKEIVTENESFDLEGFIPTLREKMLTKNEFARQFIISWVSVLDTVPDIDMVIFLPDILDGVFKILEDPRTEIKTLCGTLLQQFLRSIKEDPSRVDFNAMTNIVILHCQSVDDMLQFTAITWIKEFVLLSGREILPFTSGILTAVLPCLAYDTDLKQNIKETAKSVNSSLMKLVSADDDVEDTEGALLNLDSVNQVLVKFLNQTKVPTKVAVLKWIYHLHINVPNRMCCHVEKMMPMLLHVLSDCADQVVQQALEVIAQIVSSHKDSKPEKLEDFVNSLARLFYADRRLLENRGDVIIRQLCTLLNSEDVYLAFSSAIQQEKNLDFASTMVDYLNTILLTSGELFELRARLKELSEPSSVRLFTSLYTCWAHNPVATVALCLLSHNYHHACDLIHIFGSLEVTVEFLIEIDKLVQLIESPIFAYLRLELIDVDQNQHLVQVLYGLLMLLPQTDAFNTLRHRLHCIPNIHLHPSLSPKKPKEDKVDFTSLLIHFKAVQARHRKEKLESRPVALLEKGVMNI